MPQAHQSYNPESDPAPLLMRLIQQDWPEWLPEVVWGHWPDPQNSQSLFFINALELNTYINDKLDIAQRVYFNSSTVQLHVMQYDYNGDSTQLYGIAGFIDEWLKESQNKFGNLTIRASPTTMVETGSDIAFHSVTTVNMRYLE